MNIRIRVRFVKVETDKQTERWTQPWQQTNGIPEFQFWKVQAVVDLVSGANDDKIRNTVQKHM